MKIIITSILLILLFPVVAQKLKPFTSDGCSMFPDRLEELGDWCSCCVEHDIAYWQGGSEAQKDSADECLRECVWSITLSDMLSNAMFRGVQVGGSAFFPVWYRWGYGWDYGRGYDTLQRDEIDSVHFYLDQFYQGQVGNPCK